MNKKYLVYQGYMRIRGKVMMSCLAGALCASLFLVPTQGVESADEGSLWGDYQIKESNTKYAEDLLDRIVGQEKRDTGIIQTDLDGVDQAEGGFYQEMKISNTLDSTRQRLSSYLEWFAFLGLSAAVALIVYNGILLVFSPLAEDQVAQVKKRMMYIIAGALLITGFYFIMRILLSVLVDILSRS